jgi:hypothetical protein
MTRRQHLSVSLGPDWAPAGPTARDWAPSGGPIGPLAQSRGAGAGAGRLGPRRAQSSALTSKSSISRAGVVRASGAAGERGRVPAPAAAGGPQGTALAPAGGGSEIPVGA